MTQQRFYNFSHPPKLLGPFSSFASLKLDNIFFYHISDLFYNIHPGKDKWKKKFQLLLQSLLCYSHTKSLPYQTVLTIFHISGKYHESYQGSRIPNERGDLVWKNYKKCQIDIKMIVKFQVGRKQR